MAYNPALTDATSRIRFVVSDTDDAAPLLPEATYTALLGLYATAANPEGRATIAAAEALLAKLSRDPDTVEVTGAIKVAWTERIAALRALANGLRVDLGLPTIGGVNTRLVLGRMTRAATPTSEYGG